MRVQAKTGIIREVVHSLISEYAVQPLGRLKEFAAASCEEIRQAYSKPMSGQYWIANNRMEPTLQFCSL